MIKRTDLPVKRLADVDDRNGKVGDFDGRRKGHNIRQIKGNLDPAPGTASFEPAIPQLHEEQVRGLRRRVQPAEFGKAAQLLQHFHDFYFGRHNSVLTISFAGHVPEIPHPAVPAFHPRLGKLLRQEIPLGRLWCF
jgi:hypothetical protein